MKKKNYGYYLLAVLFLGFLLRLLLYKTGTFFSDFYSFVAWSNTLVEKGFKNYYSLVWSDYLPGYLYVLWLLGKLGKTLNINQLLLYKFPAIFFDLATGYLIYRVVEKIKNRKLALISSSFYIFNPAIIFNSTLWGQVDSLTAFFYLLSIFLIGENIFASAAALAIGTAIKPQVALAAPIILFVMVKKKWRVKKIIGYILFSFTIILFLFIPFIKEGTNPFVFIYERVMVTLNQYPFASVNAFNLWGLWGFWKPDGVGALPPKIIGLLVFGAFSFLGFRRFIKVRGSEYFLASVLLAGNFLFFTRMHERHLLPLFAPLAVAASLNPSLWIAYFGFSSTYVLNLYFAYEQIVGGISHLFSEFVIKAIIFANFVFLGILFLKKKGIEFIVLWKKRTLFPKINLSKRTLRAFLFGVLAFSVLSRTAWLWSPPGEYFDEVYHAFTAREILHGNPKAWEWWNTPPEGFAYEWTHPPLAKLGMVVGMLIFGENAFGWRIPGALLGAGSVFLIYLIARKILKDELAGILAAGVFALDGLTLVMARIGMNDSYLLFFVLASIYFFLKNKNFWSALAFGLALSSKWSAIWAVPIIALAHFIFKKKIKLSYLWFFILPPAVYLASYIPMFLTGHGLAIFWGMQKQMWWYHTGLKATHPYTSLWWNWPLLVRPIYLYTSNEIGGMVSRIYAMGNPAVFWTGFAACLYTAIEAFRERNKKLALVVFSYFIFFVPWAASPRIMFLYHYLPSIPFLAMATAYVLRRYPKFILYFFISFLILFIYFYPHWTGMEIPLNLDRSYYWFTSWR